jgi:predicted lipoprotein with Yx(FWY)xxD motif
MRGRVIRWGLPLALLALVAAGAVVAMADTTTASDTIDVGKTSTLGTVLVAANGHTLYRYTVDGKNINRCSSIPACNTYWPALLVKTGTTPTVASGASAKLAGTIGAAHGMRQVTYAGFPLYFFSGDKKAGQTNGQGFDKKWYVISTNGSLVRHTVKAPATTSSTTTTSSGGGYHY